MVEISAGKLKMFRRVENLSRLSCTVPVAGVHPRAIPMWRSAAWRPERGALMASLDPGHFDIAILIGHADYEGFRREAFWSERVFLALSKNHPLAARPHLYWTNLRGEHFLLTAADPGPFNGGAKLGQCGGVNSAMLSHHPPAVLRGRPPFAPLVRDAAALAGDFIWPACRARARLIHAFVPKTPDTSAGTYKSASSAGQ